MTFTDLISQYVYSKHGDKVWIKAASNDLAYFTIKDSNHHSRFCVYKDRIEVEEIHAFIIRHITTISMHDENVFNMIDSIVNRPNINEAFDIVMDGFKDHVNLRLEDHSRSCYYIKHISSNTKGRGYGKKVLSRLCDLSDKYLMSIYANVVPLKINGYDMSEQKLNQIYADFGFVKCDPTEIFLVSDEIINYMTNFKVRRPKYD